MDVRSIPGLSRFSEVHQLQKSLVEQRILDQIPDTLILCEHTPVITRGRGLQFKLGRTERERPLPSVPSGTDFFEIERGGDLTWHGPGQLVAYPIFKLVDRDIDRWIRLQERVWIRALSLSGIEGFSKDGESGVWTRGARGPQKLVSVGIAVKKWVSYHGTAGNLCSNLGGFLGFDPCGFEASVMARVQDLEQTPSVDWSDGSAWRGVWEARVVDCFNLLLGEVKK